ncbi:hypothetical protein [Halorarius litoreus]|uniref:hypothetical protein n=1 Tax=Halorarius litoreus TaxID=2962676 RepID=UPI0020CD7C75|nr:hypothetical protein [Halorarius litoreus]
MHGPSPNHDERELRPRDEPTGLWQRVDDLSSGGAEVLFLSLPGLVVLVNSGYRPADVSFAALVSLLVVTVGVTARSRWVDADPPWPNWRVSTVVFRVLYYSLTMLLLGVVGGFVAGAIGGLVGLAVVVVLLAGLGTVAVAALPRLAATLLPDPRPYR